jgi:hypothetical protein
LQRLLNDASFFFKDKATNLLRMLIKSQERGNRMIKLVYILRRREDVPADEFYKYWLESHGPLVRSLAEALHAKKYVQSHTISTPLNAELVKSRGMTEYFDGITEAWWDSLDEVLALVGTPEVQQAMQTLAEDEAKFIDLAESTVFLTEEHEIFDFTR